MGWVSEFRVGDRVDHSLRGLGTVRAVGGAIRVKFDDNRGIGIFDDDWPRIAGQRGVTIAKIATPSQPTGGR